MVADPYVKVWFELLRDEDGWPPAASEGLWALRVTPDTARLDNTPWFVRGIACGDLIRFVRRDDGLDWFEEQVEWCGNFTIRVVPFRDGPLRGSREQVLRLFEQLGATGEGIEQYGMVALDIPPTADLAAVKMLLREGREDGRWDYEEGCVGDPWNEQ